MSQNPKETSPPPSCDEKAQQLTRQFIESLKESVPELDGVAVVYDWKFKSKDLPMGGAYGIPGPLDADGMLRLAQRISLFNVQIVEIVRRALDEGTRRSENDQSVGAVGKVHTRGGEGDTAQSDHAVQKRGQ